jgi:hypothetical protein
MLEKLCKNCKHYRETDATELDPPVGFCGSAQAKNLVHPIGFLASDARACELFQVIVAPGTPARSPIPHHSTQFCGSAGL